MNDADYYSAFTQLLEPVAREFQPELVLVSSGFKTVLGDPQGEYVNTQAFDTLTRSLMGLAEDRLILAVENEGTKTSRGGESRKEMKMRGKMKGSIDEMVDQLNNRLLKLNLWEPMNEGKKTRRGGESRKEMKRRGKMKGSSEEMVDELSNRLQKLDLSRRLGATGTGLVYSDIFSHHQHPWRPSHKESPLRVTFIMKELETLGLLSHCIRVEPREATGDELLLIHTKPYVDIMKSTQTMSESELETLSIDYTYVYLHPESFKVSSSAVGALLQLIDRVMTSELRNGFSVIRPPGLHAEANGESSFCVFNSVAIAARYAQFQHSVSRVLIVDWDVDHGFGTQRIFQEDPSVLYFRIHSSTWDQRDESDRMFSSSRRAEGRTINVAWNKRGMNDADYYSAFTQLLEPVAREFQPELVLVSSGFKTVLGDPQGEYVNTQAFDTLTRSLMGLAEGRLILAVEGGYNLQSTAWGVAACVEALIGRPTDFMPCYVK